MEQLLGTVLGVVVILAGFWAYITSQFQGKEVAAEQARRLDEKLDGIATDVRGLRDLTIVKSTINELADRWAEVHTEKRLSARNDN